MGEWHSQFEENESRVDDKYVDGITSNISVFRGGGTFENINLSWNLILWRAQKNYLTTICTFLGPE